VNTGNKLRILLAEDHAVVRSGLRAVINAQDDMEVVAEAEDGITAVEKAVELQPDVILMDVFLAESDGMVVLADLRSSPDLAHLRVVMSSGMDLEEQCLAAGANAFLLKPYSPDQLTKVINENLGADGGGPADSAPNQEQSTS